MALMWAHFTRGAPLPASQLVRTSPAALHTARAAPRARDIPPMKLDPAGGNRIAVGTLRGPSPRVLTAVLCALGRQGAGAMPGAMTSADFRERGKCRFAGASDAGGGTRTPDTRIMIPLL
jgi:hypothetical protein